MTRLVLDREIAPQSTLEIEGDEARYLLRVRRQRIDDLVELRSLAGRRYRARITAIERASATLLVEVELPPAPEAWPVQLIVAVPKRQLLDEVIRRSSEIGVARISPVICERTVARPGSGRIERWERIASEAMRQCGRASPLVVDPVRPFEEALLDGSSATARILLHPGSGDAPSLLDRLQPRTAPASIAIAIGPEGGFAPAELAFAADQGFVSAGLGQLIMRVETAAVVAAGLAVAFVGGFD